MKKIGMKLHRACRASLGRGGEGRVVEIWEGRQEAHLALPFLWP